jgi:Rieske Fe-S protein
MNCGEDHENDRAREMPHEPCERCSSQPSRREFLGQVSVAVVASMVGVEVLSGSASALPVVAARGAQGGMTHTYPLPAADGVTIDHDAEVILVRFQQRVYAFSLACPHEETPLRWRDQDVRFQCPRHESKYKPDGTFIEGRATRNMDRYGLKRSGNSVVVDLSRAFHSDQQPAEWAAAVITL